jgi:flagellar motor switch protein FliN/FliY
MKDPSEIRLWLIRTVSEQLHQVLETMAGESPLMESTPTAEPPSADVLYWNVSMSAAPGAALTVAASNATWTQLGARVLSAAGLDLDDDPTVQSTFLETLDQALSGVAQSATSQLGREVSATPSKLTETRPGSSSDQWASLELVFGDQKSAKLYFLWNDKLLAGLTQEPPPPPPAPAAEPRGGQAPQQSMPMVPQTRNADLLFDVELPVCVSFGRAHLQLKDLIKLTTGSIVELNRTVTEPVEIIVNNCVIARGEVVVVEGNFGVRINEVISRNERLRTLH